MTALNLRRELARLGVVFRVVGSDLRYFGREDVLTDRVRAAIAAHKHGLMDLVRADARFRATGLPDALRDEWEERAGILEYDAGLTRAEAESRARAMVLEAHRNAALAVVRPEGVTSLGARTTAPRPGDLVDAAPAGSVRDDAIWDRVLDEMDGWSADRRGATFARAGALSKGGLSHDDAFLRAFAEIRGAELPSAPGIPHGPAQADEGAE